jgi:hypothetical protein
MTLGHEKKDFAPEGYPALLEFLPAYLHEDFSEEYGSATAAFAALICDASADQVRQVRAEWAALRHDFSGRGLHDLQHALTQLGAAWLPQSEQELQAVDEILTRAEP